MLVLSRRPGQKVLLPDQNVTVEVVRFQGNVVRLGISAPPDVRVLREEVADRQAADPEEASRAAREASRRRHAIRNQLNAMSLGLHLVRRQLRAGLGSDADGTLDRVLRQFKGLEVELIQEQPAPPPAPAPVAAASKLRTLVVEDDVNECQLLAGLLRCSGFEVSTAGDGADALDYLNQHHVPDVVLLDMMMPRIDGPHTVAAIRNNPRLSDVKIFAISGTHPGSLGVSTGPGGIDRWFEKPVDPESLVEQLQRELVVGHASC